MGARVGSKVLEIIEREQLVARSKKMGTLFLEKLKSLYEFDIVGDVRGVGLQCGIELVQDRITKTPFPASMKLSKVIGEKSIQKGVVLYPGSGSVNGVEGDHILVTPPLTINEEQIDEIVDVMRDCLKEVVSEFKKVTV